MKSSSSESVHCLYMSTKCQVWLLKSHQLMKKIRTRVSVCVGELIMNPFTFVVTSAHWNVLNSNWTKKIAWDILNVSSSIPFGPLIWYCPKKASQLASLRLEWIRKAHYVLSTFWSLFSLKWPSPVTGMKPYDQTKGLQTLLQGECFHPVIGIFFKEEIVFYFLVSYSKLCPHGTKKK